MTPPVGYSNSQKWDGNHGRTDPIQLIVQCTSDGHKGKLLKDDRRIFADPYISRDLLVKYPDLTLCMAHFCEDSEWMNFLNTPWEKKIMSEPYKGTIDPNLYSPKEMIGLERIGSMKYAKKKRNSPDRLSKNLGRLRCCAVSDKED